MLGLLCCSDPESPAAKHEWSVLESVDIRNRAKPIGEMEIVQEEGYHFLCVGANGSWLSIMLDPKRPPYYKQMPKGDYKLTAAQLQVIKDSRFATPTVLECLLSHVSER
jgi:hypothetical protein